MAAFLQYRLLTLQYVKLSGDVLQNPVISGEPFFFSEVFWKGYYVAALFKYGHRFQSSNVHLKWQQLLSRLRKAQLTKDDVNAFHDSIGGILFPGVNAEISEQTPCITSLKTLVSCANSTVIQISPTIHGNLQPHRLSNIASYRPESLGLTPTPQEIALFPPAFPSQNIVVLCSERNQRQAYNFLANTVAKSPTTNDGDSPTLQSIAEDTFTARGSKQLVKDTHLLQRLTEETSDEQDIMYEMPARELKLKVGMCVSISDNAVGHYWVKNMKVIYSFLLT
jgi:hypothetical protein